MLRKLETKITVRFGCDWAEREVSVGALANVGGADDAGPRTDFANELTILTLGG